jgi:hypothetical protein
MPGPPRPPTVRRRPAGIGCDVAVSTHGDRPGTLSSVRRGADADHRHPRAGNRASGYLMRPPASGAPTRDDGGHTSGRPCCAALLLGPRHSPTTRVRPSGRGRRPPASPDPSRPARSCATVESRTAPRPLPPYNPHSIAAAQPRGFVQQGLSALSPRRRFSRSLNAVRMKPYSLGGRS